jgi:hypothetical protein
MPELIGQVLNRRYRVESGLGRGGMAEVFKVWDQERAVHLALKLLRDDMSEDPVFFKKVYTRSPNPGPSPTSKHCSLFWYGTGRGTGFLLDGIY